MQALQELENNEENINKDSYINLPAPLHSIVWCIPGSSWNNFEPDKGILIGAIQDTDGKVQVVAKIKDNFNLMRTFGETAFLSYDEALENQFALFNKIKYPTQKED